MPDRVTTRPALSFLVLGPVLCRALRRLASNWRNVKSLGRRPGWLSLVGGNGRDEKPPCVLPKPERRCSGINVDQRPPCFLVDLAVQLAVVDPAKRDGELVADLATEGARLHKAEMVGIAGLSTTYQARERGDKIEVLLVADPPRPLRHRASILSTRIRLRARGVFGPVCRLGNFGLEMCVSLPGQSAVEVAIRFC